MKPELKKRWIKALRSGKFKQGTGALFEDGRYCCLGVLCEVAKGKPPNVEPINYYSYFKRYGLDIDTIESLCFRNDEGRSFKEIATFVELRGRK